MEYYDLILGSIPGSILAVTGVLSLFGIGVTTAIPIGAAIAIAIILHALFVRSPSTTDPEPSQSPSYQTAD